VNLQQDQYQSCNLVFFHDLKDRKEGTQTTARWNQKPSRKRKRRWHTAFSFPSVSPQRTGSRLPVGKLSLGISFLLFSEKLPK
jgi:hypothetical protein